MFPIVPCLLHASMISACGLKETTSSEHRGVFRITQVSLTHSPLPLPSLLTHPLTPLPTFPLSLHSLLALLSQLPTLAPTGLTIDNVTTTTFDLSWDELLNATSHANSSDIIGYRIYHQASGDRGCDLVSCAAPNQCQEEPMCIFGQCIHPSKPNNMACDDGNDDTEGDHCLDGECVGTSFNAHVNGHDPVFHRMTMNTRSYGGGFFPRFNEFWFPMWELSTVYRYTRDGAYVGSFFPGVTKVIQIWGEPDSNYYYTANWSSRYCTKRGPFPFTREEWAYYFDPNTLVSGVSTDATFAYCILNGHSTLHVLDKMTGQQNRTVELTGGNIGTIYGGLAVVGSKIYYGHSSGTVYRHNLLDGQYDGYSFSTQVNIESMAFTGQDYCISQSSDDVYCYRVCLMRSMSCHPL